LLLVSRPFQNGCLVAGENIPFDDLVESLKIPFFVFPAKAGIPYFQIFINTMDSGFYRSDDFLRDHHFYHLGYQFSYLKWGS